VYTSCLKSTEPSAVYTSFV